MLRGFWLKVIQGPKLGEVLPHDISAEAVREDPGQMKGHAAEVHAVALQRALLAWGELAKLEAHALTILATAGNGHCGPPHHETKLARREEVATVPRTVRLVKQAKVHASGGRRGPRSTAEPLRRVLGQVADHGLGEMPHTVWQ